MFEPGRRQPLLHHWPYDN